MKSSNLWTSGLLMIVLSHSVTAQAQGLRNPNSGIPMNSGYGSGMSRSLFGLPMPQQWSGGRSTGNAGGFNAQGYGPAGYAPSGYPANCANGQCQNGSVNSGLRAGSRCVNGQCPTGACLNGQCRCESCPNGQCSMRQPVSSQFPDGNYSNGYRGASNCPTGRCPQGMQSGQIPRSGSRMLADPFRRSGTLSDSDQWTPRAVVAPRYDSFGSAGYNREDLDLRSEYFRNESGTRNDLRGQTQSRSDFNTDGWTLPSRRSMEAPAESRSGIARF